MKRRFLLTLIILILGLGLIIAGCDSAGAGDGGSDTTQDETTDDGTSNSGGEGDNPESPADFEDPTAAGDELLEEGTNESLVADEETGVFTVYVRDRDTDEALTDNVTVNVRNGTASAVDENGAFTITPDSDEWIQIQVLVRGYAVGIWTEYDETGTNIVYKEALDDRVFGEWTLYKVEDPRTGEESDIFDETVTLREDGSVSWTGDRAYQTPDYYYSTTVRDDGNVTFGQKSAIDWVLIRSSEYSSRWWAHGGILTYVAGEDILSMSATHPVLATRGLVLYYTRDGLDPDAGNGTGSFSFQGTTYESVAGRTDFLDSWTIVPTEGDFLGFTVMGVPSTDGAATVAEDGLSVFFTTSVGTQYVAGSGSTTRSGNNLSFSFEMFEGTVSGPAAGTLSGEMYTTDDETISIPKDSFDDWIGDDDTGDDGTGDDGTGDDGSGDDGTGDTGGTTGAYDLFGSGYDLNLFGYYDEGTFGGVDDFLIVIGDDPAETGVVLFNLTLPEGSGVSFPTGTFTFVGELSDPLSANSLYRPYFEADPTFDSDGDLVSAAAAASHQSQSDFKESNGPDSGSVSIGTYGQITGGTVVISDNGDGSYTITWDLSSSAGSIIGTYSGTPEEF